MRNITSASSVGPLPTATTDTERDQRQRTCGEYARAGAAR